VIKSHSVQCLFSDTSLLSTKYWGYDTQHASYQDIGGDNPLHPLVVESYGFTITILVARRTSTTSPSQSPNSQEQQQQQHPRSNVVQSIFSVVDVTPKNNIEKSLQQHHQYQTAGRDRGTNCSGAGEVCSCSPEGETVVQTTSLTTPSTLKCTSALAKTSNDSQNTLRTRFSQEV